MLVHYLPKGKNTIKSPLNDLFHKREIVSFLKLLLLLVLNDYFPGPEPTEELMAVPEAQYTTVSKSSRDSFSTSSTSSGECYENTKNYVMVLPGQSHSCLS